MQRQPVVVINENARARVLEDAGDGPRQAAFETRPANPWREIVGVVGDERDNGLQPAGADDRVLADGDERVLGPCRSFVDAEPGVRDPVRTHAESPAFHARAAAGRLVGEREPASRQPQVARRDSRRVDGADLVRADDAGDCGGGGAAAGRRGDLRRHRLHRRRSARARSACGWRLARRPPMCGGCLSATA